MKNWKKFVDKATERAKHESNQVDMFFEAKCGDDKDILLIHMTKAGKKYAGKYRKNDYLSSPYIDEEILAAIFQGMKDRFRTHKILYWGRQWGHKK